MISAFMPVRHPGKAPTLLGAAAVFAGVCITFALDARKETVRAAGTAAHVTLVECLQRAGQARVAATRLGVSS